MNFPLKHQSNLHVWKFRILLATAWNSLKRGVSFSFLQLCWMLMFTLARALARPRTSLQAFHLFSSTSRRYSLKELYVWITGVFTVVSTRISAHLLSNFAKLTTEEVLLLQDTTIAQANNTTTISCRKFHINNLMSCWDVLNTLKTHLQYYYIRKDNVLAVLYNVWPN